jgi:glutathionylspermidine synthase
VQGGATLAESAGDYGAEGFVYQALYDLPGSGTQRPVIGAWMVDGAPAGMGIREDGLITGNTARFVPHIVEG